MHFHGSNVSDSGSTGLHEQHLQLHGNALNFHRNLAGSFYAVFPALSTLLLFLSKSSPFKQRISEMAVHCAIWYVHFGSDVLFYIVDSDGC